MPPQHHHCRDGDRSCDKGIGDGAVEHDGHRHEPDMPNIDDDRQGHEEQRQQEREPELQAPKTTSLLARKLINICSPVASTNPKRKSYPSSSDQTNSTAACTSARIA